MNVINKVEKGVTYFAAPILEREELLHGFSTRLGGVSEGDCRSMNLGFSRGDEPEAVMVNHKRFAEAVGYEPEKLVLCNQVHETVVRRVDSSDCGKGIFRESDILGVDGLVTDDPEVVLMTFFADCVPLFFYDRKKKAVAASHSGWRGTVRRMGAKTVEVMTREFGTRPEDLLAVVGPSICQNCYEVSRDVAEAFLAEFGREQWEQISIQKPDDKFLLDLWRANEIVLYEAGIPEEQIQVSGVCTCCNPELLFSHRASGGKRGSLAGVISLAKRKHRS